MSIYSLKPQIAIFPVKSSIMTLGKIGVKSQYINTVENGENFMVVRTETPISTPSFECCGHSTILLMYRSFGGNRSTGVSIIVHPVIRTDYHWETVKHTTENIQMQRLLLLRKIHILPGCSGTIRQVGVYNNV